MDGKTVAIVALGSALVVVFLLALFLVRWICVLNRPYQRQRNVKPAHTSMIDDTIIASDSPESSGRLALLPLSTADDLSQDASPTEIPALDICSSLESPELPPKPIQPSLALTKTAISDKGEKRNTHEVVHIRNRSGSGRMNDSGSVGKSGFGSFQGPAIEIPIDDIPPENSAFPNDSSLSSKVEGDTARFRLLWKDHSPILSVSIPLDTISAALTSRANTITSQTTESDNGSCRVFRREQSTIAPQTRQSSAIRSNRTKLERTGSIEYEELTDEIEASTARYLGVTLDENLRWSPQVTSIVRRTAMKLRILRQIRHCLTVRQAMLYYSALVIPDILYASNAFLPGLSAEQRNTVAKLDKRCIRCVADEHPLAHTLPLYTRLGVCSVLERGECKLRLLTFRIRSGIVSELLSSRIVLQGPPTGMTTRGQLGRNLPLPLAHSASGACRPLLASCRLWNGLPDCMKSIVSVREFKRMLRVFYFG
ncbi:uncharacterized protein LOC135811687 [Sycon ciliatum]|uniref:uncharacterized protein LOC135811687 n=1 Tax=Sycon ciliatum TaxID=27933 RepID=UPI0031F68A0A